MVEFLDLKFWKINLMKITINPKPITKENFSKFGDMITTDDIKPLEINNGYAKRFDGIANLDTKKIMVKLLLVYFFCSKKIFSNEN